MLGISRKTSMRALRLWLTAVVVGLTLYLGEANTVELSQEDVSPPGRVGGVGLTGDVDFENAGWLSDHARTALLALGQEGRQIMEVVAQHRRAKEKQMSDEKPAQLGEGGAGSTKAAFVKGFASCMQSQGSSGGKKTGKAFGGKPLPKPGICGDLTFGDNGFHIKRGACKTGCLGWAPSKGKWKGAGAYCAPWAAATGPPKKGGWTPWCWVDKDYDGPSKEYKNRVIPAL